MRARHVLSAGALLVSMFVFATSAAAAPPANDMFAAAQAIAGESGSVSGTNFEATREPGEPNHAGEPSGRSVWYRWTAPVTSQIVLDTCGGGFDTLLAVYTGSSVNALSTVAGNDDACADQSRVAFSAVAGTVYSIAVDGYEGAQGSFTLRWSVLTAPPNDNFAAAQQLAGARGSVEGTTFGATTEPGEPSHAGGVAGASVWYTWTAPSAGVAAFDTCTDASFDTVLGVYTGDSVAALTRIANDDDSCRLQSRVRFATRAGAVYRIAIDGADTGDTGSFVLRWVVAGRPANDSAASARRLRGTRGSARGTNEGALGEAGVDHTASVWYRWRAPRTMGISFDTCQSTFDTVLAVYRGRSLRGAVRIDVDDDGCGQAASRVAFLAKRGIDYLIAVDGFGGAWGNFTLRWRPAGRTSGFCRVPDVRGLTLGQARTRLEQNDCQAGRVAFSRSAIIPRGRVISQFPGPGTRLRFLARVNLEVSSG